LLTFPEPPKFLLKILEESVMDHIILAAITFAILVRIIAMDGYSLKPFYKDGKFQLNIIGTIIVGAIGAYGLMEASPELFASPFVAFMTVYMAPHLLDKAVTKITPTTVQEGIPEEDMD
jgi:hypothetical protein